MAKNDDKLSAKSSLWKNHIPKIDLLCKLRDGALVAIAVIYFAGYITWALVARIYGLGSVSVFDTQYFVAGFPIVFIVGLLIYVFSPLYKIIKKCWPEYLEKSKNKKLVVFLLTILFSISYFLLIIVLIYRDVIPFYSIIGTGISIIVIFCLLLLSYSESEFFNKSGFRVLAQCLLLLFIVSCFLITMIYYSSLYIKIPQSMGGGKPQLALLDVKTSELSEETLNALYKKPVNGQKIVRTNQVSIVHSNKQSVIILFFIQNSEVAMLELPRSAIAAIIW